MKKQFITFTALILMAATSVQAGSNPSYWELLRVPVNRPAHNADITLNTESLLPLGDFGKNLEFGGGGTVGMHWYLGNWRLGFETGGWILFGGESKDGNSEEKPVDYLIMAPLYGIFGYRFSIFDWLSIIPAIGAGASFDVLKYIEGGGSVINPGEKTEIWNIHQIGRASLQIWFDIFTRISFYLGMTYTASIEYQDFSVGHLATVQLGATWKY